MIGTIFAAAALLAVQPGPEPSSNAAAARPGPEEVRIPMAGFSIRNFRTVGDDVVYLEGRGHVWYRATLAGACLPLPNALRIGFDTHGSSTLDNMSSLIVDGRDCRIHSLVRGDPPPPRRRR